jgi:hypothetical protein
MRRTAALSAAVAFKVFVIAVAGASEITSGADQECSPCASLSLAHLVTAFMRRLGFGKR